MDSLDCLLSTLDSAESLQAENAALRAEIAELRRDAERWGAIAALLYLGGAQEDRETLAEGAEQIKITIRPDGSPFAILRPEIAIQRTAPTERPNSLKEEGGSPNPAPTEAQTVSPNAAAHPSAKV